MHAATKTDTATDLDWETRVIRARFRSVADGWALDVGETARLLDVPETTAEAVLRVHMRIEALGVEAEHRLRLAVEADAAMRRAFSTDFAALAWLRLDKRPSRLERMAQGPAAIREALREAEALAG